MRSLKGSPGILFERWMHARERAFAQRDTNRIVRPFEWGASFIFDHVNGDDPRELLRRHTREVLQNSERFYALPQITDYELSGEQLTWTSAVHTPSVENNTVHARYFPATKKRKDGRRPAVLLLPQWNAQPESHVELCRILNRFGISALRLTLPYHEARRPPELERADYLFSSNIGRTIQSMRQGVLDARTAITWLTEHQGHTPVGILGTSIGSCVAFLAYAHDERLAMGVFNHGSGYVADVTWRGITTQHVRAGFGDKVTLDELREYLLPISPMPFIPRLKQIRPRPMLFLAARYDLSFPPDLTHDVLNEFRRHDIPVDTAWLACGHYTSGEKPWVYQVGWKIASYFRKHL